MPIQTSPKTVSLFSESSSTTAIEGPYYQSSEAGITGGGEGSFILLSRAVGGSGAAGTRYNTGTWAAQMGIPFDSFIANETAGYIAIRFGDPDDLNYAANINWLVDKVVASGRKPIIVNYPQLPDTPHWTAARRTQLAAHNGVLDGVCAAKSVPLADIRNMAVAPDEMHPDSLHLLPVATHRLSVEIGKWFKDILTWY